MQKKKIHDGPKTIKMFAVPASFSNLVQNSLRRRSYIQGSLTRNPSVPNIQWNESCHILIIQMKIEKKKHTKTY